MKSKKVTELFFLVVGCIAMGLYIAMLFEWIDCADWFILPSKFISGQYEQAKAFTPILYITLALLVLIRMTFISYAMGKTVVVIPHSKQQLRLVTGSKNDLMTEEPEKNKTEVIRERHQQQLIQRKRQIMTCVLDYVELTLAPYMKTSDLHVFCNNIKNWETSKDIEPSPSITNGQLSTLDLRHLAWNIGERFKWNGEQRAIFIKRSFPNEFRDLEIKSIRQNLRQHGTCIIPIDIPDKGCFKFHTPSASLP